MLILYVNPLYHEIIIIYISQPLNLAHCKYRRPEIESKDQLKANISEWFRSWAIIEVYG